MDSTESSTFAAWIAGFFDGEGTIVVTHTKHPKGVWQTVQASLFQSEPQHHVLYEIQRVYGGRIYVRQEKHWKPKHTLCFSSQRECHGFLTAIMPFLRIKHDKAVNALALIGEPCRGRGRPRGCAPAGVTAVNAVKTHCIHGHEFTPENTVLWHNRQHQTGRACRACRIDFARLRRQDRKARGLCARCGVRPVEMSGRNKTRCQQCRDRRQLSPLTVT